jgi:hypothetical protein
MNIKNKIYYIIGYNFSTGNGLGSIVTVIMTHILYAVHMGYIPVVDLKNFDCAYFKDNTKGKDNVWEYFFEQPYNISLDDIEENATIIHSNQEILKPFWKFRLKNKNGFIIPYGNDAKLIYEDSKKYFRLNKEFKQYLDKIYANLIGDKKNIIGVIARGTDLKKRIHKGHHFQPSPQDLFIKIEKIKSKGFVIDNIFLATEDEYNFTAFVNKYDNLLYLNQYRYSHSEDVLLDTVVTQKNHFYNLAKDYLTSLYIISKLDYFITGYNNAASLVLLLQNVSEDKFLTSYVFDDLGIVKERPEKVSELIFSVKNKHEHKVITILGIKIKFKRKRKKQPKKEAL